MVLHVTARQEVPVRWCPAHMETAPDGADRCRSAGWAHLVPPCPLTPPLFYEIPEGDTPNE